MSDKALAAAVVLFVSLGFAILHLRNEVADARVSVNELRQMVVDMTRAANLGPDSEVPGGRKRRGRHPMSPKLDDGKSAPLESATPGEHPSALPGAGDPDGQPTEEGAATAPPDDVAIPPHATRAARVLAAMMILEYEPKKAITDAEADSIRAIMAEFKQGKCTDSQLEKRFADLLRPDQRAFLEKRHDDVEKKVLEVERIHVKNELEYADLATALLERFIRPDSP